MTKPLHVSNIIFHMMRQGKIGLFLLCFILIGSIVPTYSQQKAQVGSVSDFYNSLNSSQSVLKSSASKKAVKVAGGGAVDITINSHTRKSGGDLFVGKVGKYTASQAFFDFQNGGVNGKVIIPEEKKAYIYTTENGTVTVSSENINNVICTEYSELKTGSAATSGTSLAPPPTSSVYNLQSLPGATAVVMLDFDGHDATGSWWGNILAQPANVTEGEIIDAFNLISEDFRPFQLNITTNEAVYQAAPSNRRMRVIFTPTTDAYPGSGGVAYLFSFPHGGDLAPCWVFNVYSGGKILGETGSHEIGHTMGLLHDGRTLPSGHEEYYWGAGDWAPIMGASYYREVSHWSRGQYPYANNFEDDIAIIAGTNNGFGFRPDTHGDSYATASTLVVNNGQVAAADNNGIILDSYDRDFFTFTVTDTVNVNLQIATTVHFPNLNVAAYLNNQNGVEIVYSDPAGLANAVINTTLAPGTYFLVVMGVGEGSASTGGYASYSSIGQYSISGTITDGSNDPEDPTTCNDYIEQLSNGDIRLSVSYPVQKAVVEVFARKNGLQHLAVNITGSMVANSDGTFTYSYVMPASYYVTNDEILTRFYSYEAGQPGVFTPGPAEGVWSEPFLYNQTSCDNDDNSNTCTDMIQQLSNGNVKFFVTFPVQKAFVEVFARKNGQQNIAVNIVGSQVNNADGTYSYSYIVPASSYTTGDVILARFYSFAAGGPGVFTPGPSEAVWSQPFTYGQTTCNSTSRNAISNFENINSGNVTVYPNPVSTDQELIIAIPQDNGVARSIRITDMKGEIVLDEVVLIDGGKGVISVSGIKPGFYVLDAGGLTKVKLSVK